MSQGVIEPTAVYPPPGAGRRFYQTYNTRYVSSPSPAPSGQNFNYSNSRIFNLIQRAPGGSEPVTTNKPFPKFLGQRSLILFAWAIAMVMVSLDEWHTHHILPRPARLWYTTITYILIAAVSTIEVMVPIATLMAFGLTIAVAYQYYTGTGSFGNYGAKEVAQSTQSGGTNG